MKGFFVLFALVAVAVARPSNVVPVAYAAAPVAFAAPIASSQYHAQDELGQYSYGYASGLSSKAEVKTFDGVTRGGYSYVDAEGKLQTVQYTSDAVNGFRVAATNLPVGPEAPVVAALVAPVPVEDTVEVASAKAAHLAALEEAKKIPEEVEVVETVEAEPVAAVAVAPAAVKIAAPAPVAVGIAAPALTYAAPTLTYAAPALTYAAPALSYAYSAQYAPTITTYGAPWIGAPIAAPWAAPVGLPVVAAEEPAKVESA